MTDWRIDLHSLGATHGYCSPATSSQRGTHFAKWLPASGNGSSPYDSERDEAAEERFARQAAIALTVRHRGILPAVDYRHQAGQATLVFPRIEIQPLPEWLAARTQMLARARALDLAVELLSAVAALHAAGYVHRNLHREHVGICRDAEVILLGLGGCEPVGKWVDLEPAQESQHVGLPAHHAPERFMHHSASGSRRECSLAEDTYALAWVFAELFGPGFLNSPLGLAMLSSDAETRPSVGELQELCCSMQSSLADQGLAA